MATHQTGLSIIQAHRRATYQESSPCASGRAARTRSGRPGTGPASTSPSSPSTPTKVELCLFDSADAAKETHRIELQRADRPGLALLPAGHPPGPALRLPRPRPVRAGQGTPVQPEQGPARPVREADRPRRALGRLRCSATRSARTTCRSTSATAPRSPRWRRSSTPRSPGATTARRGPRGTRRSSTRCTSRGSPCGTRTCRRTSAAPTPGWHPSRRSTTSRT